MTPDLQPDVSLWLVALYAALNPATIWVASEMGRRADQPAKILIAAFAGAMAGFALLFVLAALKVPFATTAGRAASGIVAAAFIFGIGWASLGYVALRRKPR